MESDLEVCRICGAETELRRSGIPYCLKCMELQDQDELPFRSSERPNSERPMK